MRFGLPWRVEGIRYEACETAEAAARRAGMSLDEWLDTVIRQRAGRQELRSQPQPVAYGDDRDSRDDRDDFTRFHAKVEPVEHRCTARIGEADLAEIDHHSSTRSVSEESYFRDWISEWSDQAVL